MKWLGPAAVVVIAVLAEVTVGRAVGGPDVAFFLGRFHPLVVHLPIGFFLLVVVGELATLHPQLRQRVEPALGLLLPVSAAAALAAFLLGQLLALEGGFPAQALSYHRRLTLFAIVGMAACWVAFERQHARAGRGRALYRAAVCVTLGVLSLGAHFGGVMTRGEAYLSKYAPASLKPLLGAPEPEPAQVTNAKAPAPAAEPLVFEHVVQPILQRYCVECHGAEKQKGKLRLDSLAEIGKGGESGAAVAPGLAAKSPLLQRMLLPISDDERMPPEGKPSPKPEELALIEFWLDRGASPALKVKDALAPSAARALLEHAAGGTPAPNRQLPGSATPPAGATASVSVSASADASPQPQVPRKADPSAAEKVDASAPAAVAPVSSEAPPVSSPAPVAAGVSGAAFLSTYCVKCHGPQKQKGKLRVDSRAALLKGGAEGAALVPGEPDRSSIVTRVRLPLADDEHMPPAKESQPSKAEVAAFVAWVRAGGGAAANSGASSQTASSAAAPAAAVSGSAGTAPTDPGDGASDATAPANAPVTGSAPPPAAPASIPPPAASGSDPGTLNSLPARVALFRDAVQPLLREKCGKCHINAKPAGGLNVAQHALLLEGGYSGPAVIAKDRKASPLFARIVLPEGHDERMPPEGEPGLTADESELIGAWIDQGAPAEGLTEVASLSGGAARALSAMGVQAGPEPLDAQAGGCAACGVAGGPTRAFAVQAATLLAGVALLLARRRRG